MGLFGFGTKTKADWDREIVRLNNELANAKANLARAKADKKRIKGMSFDSDIHHQTFVVERLKADIANAKVQRKSAPK